MIPPHIKLKEGQKVYFASDFHLGIPDKETSSKREKKIVQWLCSIENDAAAIFLVGDIFDFWFEYRHTIPKGFIRLQGKLADLSDKGIPLYMFTGNHDMWMFDYFEKELDIPIIRKPVQTTINEKKFFIGHGDGLGPGDYFYKFLKQIFANKFFQRLFAFVHPGIGIGIAHAWSKKSRDKHYKADEEFLGDKEWLFQFCKKTEKKEHHDFYIFGHRHLSLNMEVSHNSRYINLGEWLNNSNYAVFDGEDIKIERF
ncbi:UDP-2,3-diacylglucosamine diphosphatase [Cytophagaceae bacterium ABcell3]|nr:UDP-2,3-diacylglucosamine diphosphatase [Cytophagaceae bacterium ABcell3]